jgi:tRNA (guanine-N7-)-methyltransferase
VTAGKRQRTLDDAPGLVAVTRDELPPLPDAVLTDPLAGRLDVRRWFSHPERPLEIEIGSGKGTFLAQQAVLQPEVNFLGIEWAREFALAAGDRVRRHRERGRLRNVRVLHADATELLRWRVPDGVARVVHLYFSDPWPKPRHHKNRVVQHRLLADVWRCLAPGGELRVVTDHADLWAWDQAHFDLWTAAGGLGSVEQHASACARHGVSIPPASDALTAPRPPLPAMPDPPYDRAAFDRPASAGEGELVGTNFERKFRREGRGFHAGVLRKRG